MNGKRVFVTGGAHGIGRGIVEAFCKAGATVAFCDIDQPMGEQTAATTNASFFEVDVTDKKALENCMQTLFQQWGDIDILINNVGIGQFTPITEMTVEGFEHILDVNLRSVFVTSRQMALHREKQHDRNPYGRIVNICSTRYLQSEAGTEAYSASKGGVYSLTHALAASLTKYRITVNCIAPGWIHVREDEVIRPEDEDFHLSRRVGRPEDIANICLFLCQDGNDFINGQCITADGGVSKKMIYPE